MTDKEDFISFDKALRDLKLRSEELRKLVSEGEIRAFRDGPDSMKFRREDIEALSGKQKGEEELNLADSLEDDTGMVTEQLSADDTLLAEVEEEAKPRRTTGRQAAAPRAAVAAPVAKEPTWVLVAAGLSLVLMICGCFATYAAARESNPKDSFPASMFAK